MSALPIRPRLSPEDRPEIEKAVVIAALSALVAGLIAWGFEELKAETKKRRERQETKP